MEDTPEPEQLNSPGPSNQPEDTSNTTYDLSSYGAPGLEALSTAATTNMQYMRQLSVPIQSPRGINTPQHTANNLDFILNPTGSEGPLTSPSVDPPVNPFSNPNPFISDVDSVAEHEVAFLLRHFGETTGQWMDLFDLGCYFAHHVPVLAVSNPLLRYSVCAYAAKQLGRVGGRKAVVGGIVSDQANMELYPNSENVDWMYIGAKYYDKAISLLMEELSHSGSQETPMTPMADERFNTPVSIRSPQAIQGPGKKRRRLSRPVYHDADETIASAAILCVYEFLDNANVAWSRHLSGTKSLFDLADREGMMPLRSPSTPGSLAERMKPSTARRATFWNFARQDFLAAFINESQTRLNTEDWDLWRAAGLLLDDHGFVMPSNQVDSNSENQLSMREDMISNALIWLMSKIVNFLATGDSIDNVYPQDRGSPSAVFGINQMTLLERWHELAKELDIWYQGLPETFKPCARLPKITDGSIPADSPRAVFSEIWYSIPMCGSTMQSYHFTKILLLINKPHESTTRRSTVANRLNSYRTIEMETRYHSHEILGIALGRPEGSVRIHQVQPLFVAGQCLTENRERKVILDLLRDIERDLGWATDYRVQQLLKDWSGMMDLPNGEICGNISPSRAYWLFLGFLLVALIL
ncbi:Zn(II)2Cys6 transcription factor protein [Rutstroemia sp. NJR-2017a WRK4]|nr:Zn(II)2Cys6 transcription factor protein [Rutstroemia sp. NJR-2017a WRK4]